MGSRGPVGRSLWARIEARHSRNTDDRGSAPDITLRAPAHEKWASVEGRSALIESFEILSGEGVDPALPESFMAQNPEKPARGFCGSKPRKPETYSDCGQPYTQARKRATRPTTDPPP